MRAFVTGGTGFIGRALVRALRARGWNVTVLARDTAKVPEGITAAPGDVMLRPTVLAAIEGHDVVFHLAAWYAVGARDRSRMERINVGGTENVLTAARDAGVPRIVYCSTVGVLGRGPQGVIADESSPRSDTFGSLYEETKHGAQLVATKLASEGVPIVSVMPGGVYGPGDTSIMGVMLRLYARRLLVVCPFQDAGVSWVHVDDVADGMIRAAERGVSGEEYILGGDNETIGGLLRRAAPFTGIRAPVRFPDRLVRLAKPLGPGIARLLRQEPNLLAEGLEILRGSLMFSSAKAERALGYEWRTIEEGIPGTVASMRARRREKRA